VVEQVEIIIQQEEPQEVLEVALIMEKVLYQVEVEHQDKEIQEEMELDHHHNLEIMEEAVEHQ
jgi:hypothetical protein